MITVVNKKTILTLILGLLAQKILAKEGSTESTVPKESFETKVTKYFQFSPLHQAVYDRDMELIQKLISEGADLEARDISRHTPLHIAAMEGHIPLIKLLLDSGAELEAKSDYNMTALHHAAERNHRYAVELLLLHGANEKALTNTDRTAADLAEIHKHICTSYYLKVEWPRQAFLTKRKHLYRLGEQMTKVKAKIPLLMIGPCEEIFKYLTVRDCYQFSGKL